MRRAALVLLPVLVLGCGTRSDDVSAVLGPEGGSLAVTDEKSPLFGVRLDVPPGALAAATTVTLSPRVDAAELPVLPAGLAAFEPVLELSSGAPFQQDVTLSFPLRTTTLREDQVLSAFHVDAATTSWNVVLAHALDGQGFVVRTREAGTWRWGLTLLETVEYRVLKPAMEVLRGPAPWTDTEATVWAQYQERMAGLRQTEDWSDCDSLGLAARLVLDTRDATQRSIEQTLATACGGCDVTIDVFISQLADYIRAKVRKELVNFIIDACNMNFLLELYLKLEAAIYFHNVIHRLSCDYDCLVKTPPQGLWGQVATYGVCDIVLVVIAIGADSAGCQLTGPP